jgi:hypothetical protein
MSSVAPETPVLTGNIPGLSLPLALLEMLLLLTMKDHLDLYGLEFSLVQDAEKAHLSCLNISMCGMPASSKGSPRQTKPAR